MIIKSIKTEKVALFDANNQDKLILATVEHIELTSFPKEQFITSRQFNNIINTSQRRQQNVAAHSLNGVMATRLTYHIDHSAITSSDMLHNIRMNERIVRMRQNLDE
jgi:hypothetical protein